MTYCLVTLGPKKEEWRGLKERRKNYELEGKNEEGKSKR
jgi:hypothetical protein